MGRIVAIALALSVASVAIADSDTRCRRDSGGNLHCVRAERDRETRRQCTQTCRRDSGGNLVCRERCR